jgi:Putative prokaryotic signal transducing protein
MSQQQSPERVVVAHTAESLAEAAVIRGLLESAGIQSPRGVQSDPFVLPNVPEGVHEVEIYVLESQVDHARRLIAKYLKSNERGSAAHSKE